MLPEARYDDYGVPLCRSNVCERIWSLYHKSPTEFRLEIAKYFERGMPGWTVDSFNLKHRIVWLRDDRGRQL